MKAKRKRPEEELCSTCGKPVVEGSHAGFFKSYLFQSLNCSCGSFDERLTPVAEKSSKKGKSFQGGDSLGSFCPACGLGSDAGSALGSITGFFTPNARCACRPDDVLSGDGMAERFWKLKEAEADKVFASVTKNVLNDEGPVRTSINLVPGAVIGGIYRIIELLGKGGMGEVYLAQNLSLAKSCALKLIPPDQVTDLSWKRFQNEAKAIASLDHINLVKVTDLGLHQGCLPYYAMEFLDGESLMDWLKARGPLTLAVVLEIFVQVCDGVHYAHRKGVIHRDIKPANIMLVRAKGDKFVVKLLDFGLVKLAQKDRQQQDLTKVGEVFGTPYYMSPEQCLGGKIDNRSDIYSIGCTMFEALTGRVPFAGKSALETIMAHQSEPAPSLESFIGPGLPPALEVVLANTLRKDPNERYRTLLELRLDLEAVGRGQDVEVYWLRKSSSSPTVGWEEADSDTVLESLDFRFFSYLKSPMFLLATGVLCSLLFFTCFLLFASRRDNSAPPAIVAGSATSAVSATPAELSLASEQKRVELQPPKSLAATEPFSTLVQDSGGSWRCFSFPDDTELGVIFGADGKRVPAKGKVRFAAGERLCFAPARVAIKFSSYLKRFRQGDVSAVMMSGFVDSPDDWLLACAAIPGVEAVDLRKSGSLSKIAVASLDRFVSLKSLSCGDTDLDTHLLSKLAVLGQLEELSLTGYFDLSPLLKRLRNSVVIKCLSFPASPVDLNGIANISTMQNLRRLSLDRFLPNDSPTTVKAIELLRKNTKLQELSLRGVALSVVSIPGLVALPSLKILRCDQTRSADDFRRRLARSAPSLKIEAPLSF